jgi:hypothetical protein
MQESYLSQEPSFLVTCYFSFIFSSPEEALGLARPQANFGKLPLLSLHYLVQILCHCQNISLPSGMLATIISLLNSYYLIL